MEIMEFKVPNEKMPLLAQHPITFFLFSFSHVYEFKKGSLASQVKQEETMCMEYLIFIAYYTVCNGGTQCGRPAFYHLTSRGRLLQL